MYSLFIIYYYYLLVKGTLIFIMRKQEGKAPSILNSKIPPAI